MKDKDSFEKSLKRASEIVEKWPDWKKKTAGVYRYSKKGSDVKKAIVCNFSGADCGKAE